MVAAMPKKKVAKVKRAKAGKGKKEGKQESKADRETDIEKAKANAALWELRVQVVDQSLAQAREANRKLTRANEELKSQLYRMERDSIDVTGFMTKKMAEKEDEIRNLQKSLKSQEEHAREELHKLAEDYKHQINEMKELFKKRSSDFNMIQDGMRKILEFQKTKAKMEQELSDIRESKEVADRQHKESLNQMELKFFKEKALLETQAGQIKDKVEEKAHVDALMQLDDSTRSVFKENVRLNEALNYQIKKTEDLEKSAHSLAEQNACLANDKNTLKLTLKKNVALAEEVSKLRAKVASMEEALELKTRELEQKEEEDQKRTLIRTHASQVEFDKLQEVLDMRQRELKHVKLLASTIVEQRTELERFFHEALAQVKQEIEESRLQYKKQAQQAYRWRMREATAGRLKFPPIRTFHNSPHSTNSVYSDMEAAARWTHPAGSKVEISDLTWEQKEQVLRLLFAKMNGQWARKASQHVAVSASTEKRSLMDSDAAGIREEQSPATFITQAPEPAGPSNANSLPDIHTA